MHIIKVTYPLTGEFNKSVVGLGYFDGVHVGHQALIKKVQHRAKRLKVNSAILTFSESIDKVLGKNFIGEIAPLNQRLKIFEELGLDICYVLEFNENIAKLDKDIFIKEILMKLNAVECVSGSDYRFGHFGQGDVEYLNSFIPVNVVKFKYDEYFPNGKISSSNIIKYIQEGNLDAVYDSLGRCYSISGEVVKGLGNGKKLGFPTANVDYTGYVLPSFGVYACNVIYNNKTYKGAVNVGTHPTIDEVKIPTVEVYIKDFNKDIYGEIITVIFTKKVRDEAKFSSVQKLKKSIKSDTFFDL